MEFNYPTKLENNDQLIEKLNEETEVLESIYDGEGVILASATAQEEQEEDASTSGSGNTEEADNLSSGFKTTLELDVKPKIGADDEKIGLLIHTRLTFDQYYPYRAPQVQFTQKKGLDEEQYNEILDLINQKAKELEQERIDNEDDSGMLFDLHTMMCEIVTEYNDTVKGRCAICLEDFCSGGEDSSIGFSDRVDLIRVGNCFHRFHLLCVHRDWFMERKEEKDQFGDLIKFKLPEAKRCPICRRGVESEEKEYVHHLFMEHPEIEDHGYDY